MKEERSVLKTVLKYGIAFICGAAVTVVMIISGKPFSAETTAEKYKILCDAFSIPGLLILLLAMLVWASGQGAFTGLGYLGRYLRRALIPGGRTKYPHETFYDYLQEKKEKKGKTSVAFLFIVGAVFLAVGIVFLILYNKSV